MSDKIKDVPNGELVPEQSELQLADIRIADLERELQAARKEIARLEQELARRQPASGAQ
jgi:predicted RNase H-like nuclease (RuvC/YqgF family)